MKVWGEWYPSRTFLPLELDLFRGLIQLDTQDFVPMGADMSICADPLVL